MFADWVVSTNPKHRSPLDVCVRDERGLGVIVHPQRTREQVQRMLTSLLRAMQRTFPDRPLEVLADDRSDDQLARLQWDPHTQQARMVWRRRLLTHGTSRVRALRVEGHRCGRWQSQA